MAVSRGRVVCDGFVIDAALDAITRQSGSAMNKTLKEAGQEHGTNKPRAPRKAPARSPVKDSAAGPSCEIQAAHGGDWIEAGALRQWAMEQLGLASGVAAGAPEGNADADPLPPTPRDLTVDLGGVDHLEGAALQILLAIRAEQNGRGRALRLTNASEQLRAWFEYAGAADLLDADHRPVAAAR